MVFSDVFTLILLQKRSLWLVSVFAKSFVWLWTFLSCDKFLLLCFFSGWSGFSGWRSTHPLYLSCFMSGFHELFRSLLMSCCCQVSSPCAHWAQFYCWRVINSSMRSCLCSVWWSRNQIIRTESTSICLVSKVFPTIKSNRWFLQTFFSLQCCSLRPPFWRVILLWFHWWWQQLQCPPSRIDWDTILLVIYMRVQVRQIAITPDTLACSWKKKCWIVDSVVLFLLSFFCCFCFFGCRVGFDWGYAM